MKVSMGMASRKKDIFMPLLEVWLWFRLTTLKTSWIAQETGGAFQAFKFLGMAFIFRAKALLP
jgi:hypothetical protein